MRILSSSDFMLANHGKKINDRVDVRKYRYETTNTTSNSKSIANMSNSAPYDQNTNVSSGNNYNSENTNKKLPLNRNFVFPSDLSVH